MANVKLLSVVGDCDLDLLPAFLNHFLTQGVETDGFFITYHNAVQRNLEPGLDIFSHFGIEPKILWTGPWVDPQDMQDSKMYFLSLLRRRYCSPEDWIVYADADEHHQYASSLDGMIKICEAEGYDYVSGVWIDRVARNGTFDAVDPAMAISQQYPIGTVISKELFQKRRKSTTKMMLARQDVIPKNAGFHEPKDDHWRCYPQKMLVHHFK